MKNLLFIGALLTTGMLFTNCSGSDDDNGNINENMVDTTAPTIAIQSPNENQTYSTNLGGFLGSELVQINAQGIDETKMASIKLTVTDSEGTILLEKTQESDADTEATLSISDGFETTNAGTYTIVFTATDDSGNVGVSNPRTFTYED
ncbi:hypothetical protein [Ascidiimonas sp. W6]|uniref:hypothetical protein n=1 Tax=Ascidiimonas meishanensis TaxID=3128903 RepID=UPI0030EEE6EF